MSQNNCKMFEEYPDIVTVYDMQRMLGIGRNKAYELVHSDRIRCIHIGRKIYIPKVRIIEFILNSP
ncbi:MAG: helix-turn-helix domain-containing protein [Ruminococcus sp.]|nr:helix-turn-helix domain-containing protein [Ruminococcus sp.]MCM1382496.1 helix-turn-helix domain-containing protein [Muribaculaceae bacterium]MCM1480378.1 helix-turn-helix domain-containing protein [Muribaculaceae bacterium]